MLKIGDQIAYIPLHAEGDIKHPDVEFGFITGFNSHDDPFCRYYYRDGGMRTTANSECTPRDMVVPHKHMLQAHVVSFLKTHGYG